MSSWLWAVDAGYSRIWQAGRVCSRVRKYIVGVHGASEGADPGTAEDEIEASDVETERTVVRHRTKIRMYL